MDHRNDEKPPSTPYTLCDSIITESGRDEKGASSHEDAQSTHSSSHSALAADGQGGEQGELDLERVDTLRRDAVKVPRLQRRGLFARFALVEEVTEPVNYNNNLKWFITFIVAFAAAAAPFGSGIVFGSFPPACHYEQQY